MRKPFGRPTRKYDYGRLMEQLSKEKQSKSINGVSQSVQPPKPRVTVEKPGVVTIPSDFFDWPPVEQERPVKTLKVARQKLARQVHWRSGNGKHVVIEGPFPHDMFRSETRDTVDKAKKLYIQDMYTRPATTKTGQYAKVLASDILEILGGENEFGEITP
jgi:hypothetical protein